MIITNEEKQYIINIFNNYPETKSLFGKAISSPEGNQTLKNNSLVLDIFPNETIDETAIEAERTIFSLLLFYDVFNNDNTKFSKLSDKNFNKLVDCVYNLTNEEKQLIEYSLACNDLGKTLEFSEFYSRNYNNDLDHDKLLNVLLKNNLNLFPGLQNQFSSLQIEQYKLMLENNINLGQFVQAECLANDVDDFYNFNNMKLIKLRLMVEFFDFAGATGHTNNSTAILVTDENFSKFFKAIDLIGNKDCYKQFLEFIYKQKINTKEDYVLARMIGLTRDYNNLSNIKSAFSKLPKNIYNEILELFSKTGKENNYGILFYYLPALIQNCIKNTTFENGFLNAILICLDCSKQIKIVENKTIDLNAISKNQEVLNKNYFENIFNTTNLIQNNSCFVGIGGGSDCIQAAMIAKHFTNNKMIISVRKDKREVINPLVKINDNVFEIGNKTSGSGRFLENAVCELNLKSYLVFLEDDIQQFKQNIKLAIKHYEQKYNEKINTIYGVDSGGDCLYEENVDVSQQIATPDQDLIVMNSLKELNSNTKIIIVTLGVDAPENYFDKLYDLNAKLILPKNIENILKSYEELEMDKENEKRFGKTALAWQAALKNINGNYSLPLPKKYIDDKNNPWNPIVNITSEMKYLFVF